MNQENTNQRLEIRTVPVSYATDWIMAEWMIVKNNYGMALGISLLMLVCGMGVGHVPLVGTVVDDLFSIFLAPGCLLVAKDWLDGKKPQFSKFFIIFENTDLLNRLLPCVLIVLVANIPVSIVGYFNIYDSFFGISVLIQVMVAILTSFSVPLMVFKNMTFQETIPHSVDAITKNIIPLFIYASLIVVMVFLGALMLGIPLLFFVFPLLTVSGYVIYASIFEGLRVEFLKGDTIQVPPTPMG